MTRKTLLAIVYSLIGLLLFLLILELNRRYQWPKGSLFIVALLFLMPGRIVGYYWRNLFRAKRYLHKGEYALSIAHSQEFLVQLRYMPWIKHLIWLTPSFWTISVQALALSNLGAAFLESGDLTQAQTIFLKALECDSSYPLPHYNLAIIATLQQDLGSANKHFELSKRLGYSRYSTFDQFLITIKNLYTRFEPMA